MHTLPFAARQHHTNFLHPDDKHPRATSLSCIHFGLTKPLSLRPNGKGTVKCRAPFFLVKSAQPIGTAAVSSTFASRRNFAASSGGVGLI